MKNIITFFLSMLLISISATAQTSLYFNSNYFSSCNSGTNTITPHVSTVFGFDPADSLLPCAAPGQAVSDTIYFTNFNQAAGYTVTSLKFDSIYLPAGLCWKTNKANNTFLNQESGVIYITGTPTGAAGRYKLRMICDITINGPITLQNQDMETRMGIRYYMRVACGNGACQPLDRRDSVSTFVADLICTTPTLSASISASGPTTFCGANSVTLTANSGTGYTYKWSTGATSRSIVAYSSGQYRVTVYNAADSAVSAPVTVTATPTCPITATITASGSTSICPGTSVILTASSAAGYTYRWTTGATTSAITVYAAGSYRVTVYSAVDSAVATAVSVSSNTSCNSTYWNPAYFSNCNSSGTTSITPQFSPNPGFSPADSLLPCAVIGQPVSDTIYFNNYDQVAGFTLTSLKFDSIYLPAGLCWKTNKLDNTFANQEAGVIYISGTPTGATGRYKLRIIADLTIPGPVTLVNQNAELRGGLRYYLRVSCSASSCPAMDRSDTVSNFVPDSICSPGVLSATITASGSTALCAGSSVTLTANAGNGYTYRWSTGATSRSIVISSAGQYRVTVYLGTDSVGSAPVTVTTTATCPVTATITASGPTAFCTGGSVTLSANSGAGYTYLWTTGATTRSMTTSVSGTYNVTVSDGFTTDTATPVTVAVNAGCGNIGLPNLVSCRAANNTVPPLNLTIPGLSPAETALPCAVIGLPVSDTIYFTNFILMDGLTIDSLKIDSVYLPDGLCWSLNKSTSFLSGENGSILIQGTTTAPAGQYKLRIIADAWLNGIHIANANAETSAGLRYHIRVACPSYSCMTINAQDTASVFIPDGSPCTTTSLSATISAGGPTTFCQGGYVELTANYDTTFSYYWSNGYRSSNTVITTSGVYNVTVVRNGDTAVSAPVTVVVNPAPVASFYLAPDPSTAHVWTAVNQCSGNALNYAWSWGDNTPDGTGPTPTHNYTDSGYYTICVNLTDANGCTNNACDSNAYLFKEQNQMIQMNVVQYILGVNDVNGNAISVKYYGGALHFLPAISIPSDIRLYDMSGKVIMQQDNWTGSSVSVDAGLSGGVYIAVLKNTATTISSRILILK